MSSKTSNLLFIYPDEILSHFDDFFQNYVGFLKFGFALNLFIDLQTNRKDVKHFLT